MKWYYRKKVEIFSGILAGILGLLILCIVKYLFVIEYEEADPLYDYQSPGNVPLKELYSDVTQQTIPKESVKPEYSFVDSSKKDDNLKVLADYYIIVGSFGNLMQAQQKADKLTNVFNTNIIVLPVTKEGYYRVSCGKYSTLEKAKDTLKSIRTNISKEAWIFSVK
jgi:hypothetical protein